jgi:hypothetical protein
MMGLKLDIIGGLLTLVLGICSFGFHLRFWRNPESLRQHWYYHTVFVRMRYLPPTPLTSELTAEEIRVYCKRGMFFSMCFITLGIFAIVKGVLSVM